MANLHIASLPSGPVILASASETRQRLLTNAGIDFCVCPALIDETSIRESCAADSMNPTDVAVLLAELKGRSTLTRKSPAEGQLLLAADQILSIGQETMGKPKTFDQARSQLMYLRGKKHHLKTAAVMFQNGERIWHHVETAILDMRPLTEDEIDHYIDAVAEAVFYSPGSYQIEFLGIHLFREISGCQFAILGLPMVQILNFLRQHGMALHPPKGGD